MRMYTYNGKMSLYDNVIRYHCDPPFICLCEERSDAAICLSEDVEISVKMN